MKKIISTKNKQLKKWKKLHTKKGRLLDKEYLIEGFHLVEEAYKTEQKIKVVLYTKRKEAPWSEFLNHFADQQKIFVSDKAMKVISTLKSPQGIAAIITLEEESVFKLFSGRWLMLDNVQDPGNVGTMIRTADAAGFTGVIFGEGTIDPYQAKVLRAMQGSNFHLQIIQGNLKSWIIKLKAQGFLIYGTEVNKKATSFLQFKKVANCALIVGNEGQGVARTLLKMTDQNGYIPILGKAESFNVSVAAGILMYQMSTKICSTHPIS
ncbi:MAG: RNA methyltransferase [Lactobacillales bacterium]|jgi:TrmH family RNA methyltransferase|nr:RNA methyltransferase [Lactobacillales bacterium]